MKKPLFLLCALAFLVFACDKTEDDEPIDENSVLLLETYSINYDGEGDMLACKFEYDAQNRLVKVNEFDGGILDAYTVLTYNDAGDLASYKRYSEGEVDWDITCQKNGNKVTCTEKDGSYTYNYTLNLGSNGLPATMIVSSSSGSYVETNTYTYDSNNNIKKVTSLQDEGSHGTFTHEANYTYDNKKCPWYSCNTSKWFWHVLNFYNYEGAGEAFLYNNFTKIEGGGSSYSDVTLSFTYVYNVAGYPDQMTINRVYDKYGDSYLKEIKFTYKKAN